MNAADRFQKIIAEAAEIAELADMAEQMLGERAHWVADLAAIDTTNAIGRLRYEEKMEKAAGFVAMYDRGEGEFYVSQRHVVSELKSWVLG